MAKRHAKFDPIVAPRLARVPSRGHAQRSIAHRLDYAFGPRARMTGRWHEGYYLAEFRVPLR